MPTLLTDSSDMFACLDEVEELLSKRRYFAGDYFTQADIRLFVTIVRFDPVYFIHFKCSKRRIQEYPHIWEWLKEMWSVPELRSATKEDHFMPHYYKSHANINPSGLIAEYDFSRYEAPHNREELFPLGIAPGTLRLYKE